MRLKDVCASLRSPARAGAGATTAPSAVVAAAATLLLALHALRSNRGLDLFDESYSLSLAAQPTASITSGDVFLYGFVVHPLYQIVNADIALYRVVGLGLLLVVAMWMALETIRLLRCEGFTLSSRAMMLMLLGVAVGVIPAFTVRSLGYRTIALLGLMVAVAGLARMTRGHHLAGGAIVGFAGLVVFTGKPTSAALLGLVTVAYTILRRLASMRTVIGLLVGLLLGITALIASSGLWPHDLAGFLVRGYRQLRYYDSYQSTASMLGITANIGAFRASLILGSVLLLPLGVAWLGLRSAGTKARVWGALLAIAFGASVAIWLGIRGLSDRGWGDQAQGLMLAVPFMTALLIGRHFMRPRHSKVSSDGPHFPWLWVTLLLGMPYVAAVGTNSVFGYAMAQAGVFWVLSLLVTVAALPTLAAQREVAVGTIGVVVGLVALTISVRMTNGGINDSEWSADVPVRVARGMLYVNEDDALALKAISEARPLPGQAVPSIDLTGIAPGYQFQLGTKPLGRPSYFGVLAGAERAAQYGLSLEKCEDRARAWLLYAESNPADLSMAHTQGALDLTRDYERIASFTPSQGPREWQSLSVAILRPRDGLVASKLGCEG